MKSTSIYILRDPRDKAIRYVGKTVDPKKRYQHWKRESEDDTWKANWFRCLIEAGECFIMEIVEVVPSGGNWAEAERRWIKYYRDMGCDLTNLSDGGEGEPGRVLSQESRDKLSRSLIGHPVSPETIEKLRVAKQKQLSDPEYVNRHRQGLVTWSRELSPEKRAKVEANLSLGRNAPKTEEWKTRMAISNRGKLTPEERRKSISATLKRRYASGELPETPAQSEARKNRIHSRWNRIGRGVFKSSPEAKNRIRQSMLAFREQQFLRTVAWG